MSYDFRLPNINADTEAGQLMQMQSYLYQLVQQLNWALNTIEAGSGSGSVLSIVQSGSLKELSKTEAQSTFNSLKPLIISSADIISAYGERIRKTLEGEYVASSDFGEFREKTVTDIQANSTSINQMYTNLQTINAQIEAIHDTQAWIKTGLLDTVDQMPIYGVEVGQQTTVDGQTVFNKYARFTADGIYFYQPGANNAIAWMSGQKLYISNAEITGLLQLGNYFLDVADGVAFMWGGN